MTKIKVNDLKKLAKEVSDIDVLYVTVDETGEIIYEVEVRQYLNYLDKINLVSSMYNSAINDEDTLQVIDYNVLDMVYKVLLVQEYSNINLPQTTGEDGAKSTDIVLAHDLLLKSGLYKKIYNAIPEQEIKELDETLNGYILKRQERYERENKIENIIIDGKDELIASINELIAKLPEQNQWNGIASNAVDSLNKVNPKTLKFLAKAIGWNNGEDIG